MTDIIFAKTNHHYDSYTDLYKLMELSGFETILVSDLDISKEGVYITAPFNGDTEAHLRNQVGKKVRRAHLIHWNIERPAGSAGSVGQYGTRQWELMGDRLFDETWVSDPTLGVETALRYVTLGSDEGLGSPSDNKEFDFCHMSAPVPRRTGIYARFEQTKIGPNCWPPERDEVLRKSKFALNIHQDIYSYQEPLRFALFAAYGLPIVSETLAYSFPYSDEYMVTAPYTQIVTRMKQVLTEDYSKYKDMGLRTRERMTKEFRFRDLIIQAVKESTGLWR